MPNPAYAHIHFGERDELLGIRRQIADAAPDLDFAEPETYHVTLAYAEDMDDGHLETGTLRGFEGFSVRVSGLSLFNNPENRALVLIVDHSAELDTVQQTAYSHMGQDGIPMSPHSVPDNWQPHITIGYLPDDMDMPQVQFEPFTMAVDTIRYARDDYQVVREITAESGAKAMPYTKRKEGDQVCVYKQDADGNPTGESLGCHDSESAADEQIAALYAQDEKDSKATTAIKALDDNGRVGGYLVVWGSPEQKDLQGEYFTPDTVLNLDWYDRRPMLYHHGKDKAMKAELVGVIESLKEDDTGVWAEAQLDMRNRYVEAVQKLIKRGVLAWSSGSLPDLVKTAPDGFIERWPIVEGSATPTPAEPRHTDINTIKAAYEQLGLDTAPLNGDTSVPAEDGTTPVIEPVEAAEPGASADDGHETTPIESSTEESDMNTEELVMGAIEQLAQGLNLSDEQKAQIAQAIMGVIQSEEDMSEERAAEVAANVVPVVAKAINDFVTKRDASKAAAGEVVANALKGFAGGAQLQPLSRTNGASNGGQSKPRIQVTRANKYSHLDAQDLGFAYDFLRRGTRTGPNADAWTPSAELLRTMADKSIKAINDGKFTVDQDAVKALEYFGDMSNAVKDDELDHSTLNGYGDQWVPDLWASSIWETVRLDNVAAREVNMIDMPSNPFELPAEGADPTVYHAPETTNEAHLDLTSGAAIPDSKIGTGKVQLSAEKLALRVGWSSELVEDSIIAVAPQFRKQAQRAMADAVDDVLLNGDTVLTSSTNLNLIDGTPTTQAYTAGNGFLKLAIITTTANTVDGGGDAISLAEMRAARATLPDKYKTPAMNLRWFVDPSSYISLLNIPEILTAAEYGLDATVIKGDVRVIDGIPILPSAEMALANSAGKIPAAGGTLGRASLVHGASWYLGYKRRPTVAVEYLSYFDAYQMTATLRLAVASFDSDCAAAIVNLLV